MWRCCRWCRTTATAFSVDSGFDKAGSVGVGITGALKDRVGGAFGATITVSLACFF